MKDLQLLIRRDVKKPSNPDYYFVENSDGNKGVEKSKMNGEFHKGMGAFENIVAYYEPITLSSLLEEVGTEVVLTMADIEKKFPTGENLSAVWNDKRLNNQVGAEWAHNHYHPLLAKKDAEIAELKAEIEKLNNSMSNIGGLDADY